MGVDILDFRLSGISCQDTVDSTVPAHVPGFPAFYVLAVLVQVIHQLLKLSLLNIFFYEQRMVPHVMADPGCLLLRLPHHLHLPVEQLFIDLKQLLLRLIIMLIPQMNVEMKDGVLKNSHQKQDHKSPHHIENGKSLEIGPVGHDSPCHHGHKQSDRTEHVHLVNEKIHAV